MKIKYKIDGSAGCLTECPFFPGVMIGSLTCKDCKIQSSLSQ